MQLWKVSFKISLSHVSLINIPSINRFLRYASFQHYQLVATDCTAHIKGIFLKAYNIAVWKKEDGFKVASYPPPPSNKKDVFHIVDNDERQSKYCFVWHESIDDYEYDVPAREKGYLKVMSQLTSGAVKDTFISTNIHYLLEPKDQKLHSVLK